MLQVNFKAAMFYQIFQVSSLQIFFLFVFLAKKYLVKVMNKNTSYTTWVWWYSNLATKEKE